MRLSITTSKNSKSYYAIKSVFANGKRTTKIVHKLGTEEDIKEKHGFTSAIECEIWAKEHIKDLTKKEKEENASVYFTFNPTKSIKEGEQRLYNGGYLFLSAIYKELGIDKLCKEIKNKYKLTYDIDSVLSGLIYSRIIFPASKLSTHKLISKFIKQPNFELNHIYRCLDVIANEKDNIQAAVYKNSLNVVKRNTNVLYYDLTNFFFEIETADEIGLRQYGVSKENRPNPIVQMGLFMDGDGIPLAFNIEKGNTNEQVTLKPLEQKIVKDFELSKFVVSTDAGLASVANRKFNSIGNRAFITTQSIKKMRKLLKEWALDTKGFKLNSKDKTTYDIGIIDTYRTGTEEELIVYESLKDKIFYKERWFNEDGFSQRYIVTFSIKYQNYQRNIRFKQLERAMRLVSKNPSKIGKPKQNDFKRFIKRTKVTADGEIAQKEIFTIDEDIIYEEKKFDGLYCVATNLESKPEEIVKINHRRWEIEESFRIMKSEFKARPVYLRKDDRITAHFITCFLALLIYRLLEKKLNEKFTCLEIIDKLREFNFHYIQYEGYIPLYKKDELSDALHEASGFRTDFEFIPKSSMKKIITKFS